MDRILSRVIISFAYTTILLLADRSVLLAGHSPDDVRFDAVNKQFDEAFKIHDLTLAARLAYQMIHLKPKNSRGYKNLCYCDEEEHNYKGAIAAMSAGIKLCKFEPKCLCLRARVYAESDQDGLAKWDYEKAIMADGESADFYNGAAIALERLEDFEAALTAINKALKLNPDSGKMHKTAGRVLEQLNRLKEAEAHLKKASQLMPKESESFRHLAVVHNMLKQPEGVIADTTSAINLGDVRGMRLVEMYRLRAEAFTRLGRLQKAKQDYDRCIEISPLQRKLFQARAEVRQKLGDSKGASQDLAKVKSLDTSIQPFNGF